MANKLILQTAKTEHSYRQTGTDVITRAIEALEIMKDRLDERFERAIELILDCKGRVILTGIGKSGHIARKIAATFTSTGAPAFFLHPTEGVHGDLGMLQKGDLLIAVSKSGSTTELELIFPSITRLGLRTILLTGLMDSTLARRVDVALDCSVSSEACPHNLTPTTSASCALVMGDALAVAVLKARNFSSEQFARLHPGGTLGQRLLLRVRDKMRTGSEIPKVSPESSVRDAIFEITGKHLGCTLVTNTENRLRGIFTDGDLRRLSARKENFFDVPITEGMTKSPTTIDAEALLDEALALMERHAITILPVADDSGNICGIIHMHDILRGNK
ncbi:MAG: KpsF/GutQ family sugar-phosphate isomerase [candidate division Zixibacteria bacterium]|nr:KpsF/GutQ family sugar-phosphate isomerase [candidate division Zixibacteria bacterium]